MQKTVLALATLILGVTTASAVDLQDCSKGGRRDRLTCLEKNVILLNSSYERVAAEARSDIAGLKKEVAALKGDVATLNRRMADLEKAPGGIDQKIKDAVAAQTADVVRYNKGRITLRNEYWGQTCLDNNTANASHIQGFKCNSSHGAQQWEVMRP